MYQHVCVCMPTIAERLRQAYPALPERAGVGSIPVEYVVSLSHILGNLPLMACLNIFIKLFFTVTSLYFYLFMQILISNATSIQTQPTFFPFKAHTIGQRQQFFSMVGRFWWIEFILLVGASSSQWFVVMLLIFIFLCVYLGFGYVLCFVI